MVIGADDRSPEDAIEPAMALEGKFGDLGVELVGRRIELPVAVPESGELMGAPLPSPQQRWADP